MWILVSLLLFFGSIGTVMAQSVGDLYQKSTQAGNDYRQRYSAYQLTKNQHVQYQTAATRLAEFDATKKLLQARNSWQINYLTYLRSYLAQTTDIADYTQTVIYLNLETEISSLNSLADTLGSGDTVETINDNSQFWEARLVGSDKLARAAITQITASKLADLQKQMQTFVDASQASDSTTLNLVKQKLQSSIDIRSGVEKTASAYKDSSSNNNTVVNQLIQSKQLLLDAASLLEQLTNN